MKLKTNFLGRSAVYFEKIDSTQSEIFRMIVDGNITTYDISCKTLQHLNTITRFLHNLAKDKVIF